MPWGSGILGQQQDAVPSTDSCRGLRSGAAVCWALVCAAAPEHSALLLLLLNTAPCWCPRAAAVVAHSTPLLLPQSRVPCCCSRAQGHRCTGRTVKGDHREAHELGKWTPGLPTPPKSLPFEGGSGPRGGGGGGKGLVNE